MWIPVYSDHDLPIVPDLQRVKASDTYGMDTSAGLETQLCQITLNHPTSASTKRWTNVPVRISNSILPSTSKLVLIIQVNLSNRLDFSLQIQNYTIHADVATQINSLNKPVLGTTAMGHGNIYRLLEVTDNETGIHSIMCQYRRSFEKLENISQRKSYLNQDLKNIYNYRSVRRNEQRRTENKQVYQVSEKVFKPLT